ncbi:MAG: glycosyltransferase [Clostridia bacterium]|nr:glycosyltransferase [Clostridia bacterium]
MDKKHDYPSYSVLMSVYAKETPGNLRQALDSMCNQTVAPNEIVMIEDGPLTEELYAVLDEYSDALGTKFVRIKNDVNLGLGVSLNKGVSACSNELIARMDTDDISQPDRCEKQLAAFFNAPELDVIGTQISEFTDTPDVSVGKRIVPCEHEEICRFLKGRSPFSHPSVMFKKSSVLSAGNYLDLHFNEDFYLWVRMYLNGAKFANLNEVLLNMRVSSDMYGRRGGIKYYKNQKQLFKFMYKNKIISFGQYTKMKIVRFTLQVLMTNKMRRWAYKKFARNKAEG